MGLIEAGIDERFCARAGWLRDVLVRIERERVAHVRLELGDDAFVRAPDAWSDALQRIAARANVVATVTPQPTDLRQLAPVAMRIARQLAKSGGSVELGATPRLVTAWEATSSPSALGAALDETAGAIRQVGCRVTWRIDAEAVSRRVLDLLRELGLVRQEDAVLLEVGEAAVDGIVGCVAAVRERLDPSALWLSARGSGPTELERFVAAIEQPVQRVYWGAVQGGSLRRLWRRLGIEASTNVLRAAPKSRDVGGRVLVTGGAGFVGSNLVARLLAEGRDVVVLDDLSRAGVERHLSANADAHDRLCFIPGDVRSRDAVRRALVGVTEVFHLAAQVAVTTSIDEPCEDFAINAGGTLGLLEEIRRCQEPPSVVFASTNKVYGALADLDLHELERRCVPVDATVRARGVSETRCLALHSPYGCSKGAGDQYMLDYAHTYGIPAMVFRMSCIYGPLQLGTEDQGWVAHFLRKALRGEPLTIYGDGKQVRDVLYVGDLVDAFLLASADIERLRGQAFNLGGGPENTLSLLELLDRIAVLHGQRPEARFEATRRGDQRYYASDTTRFSDATGWAARVGLDEGLERLYRWLSDDASRTEALAPELEEPIDAPAAISRGVEPCAS